jgi:hypothetical protein
MIATFSQLKQNLESNTIFAMIRATSLSTTLDKFSDNNVVIDALRASAEYSCGFHVKQCEKTVSNNEFGSHQPMAPSSKKHRLGLSEMFRVKQRQSTNMY